jgi:hypothetical protein
MIEPPSVLRLRAGSGSPASQSAAKAPYYIATAPMIVKGLPFDHTSAG